MNGTSSYFLTPKGLHLSPNHPFPNILLVIWTHLQSNEWVGHSLLALAPREMFPENQKKIVLIRAVESESLKVGKSLKIARKEKS